MKITEPKNTGPPEESGSNKKSFFTSKKGKTTKDAKQFESNLPEVAKRYNIRVSKPYGYYPEDVDRIITDMESDLKMTKKENDHLTKQLEEYKDRTSAIQTELTSLKMQISLMEVPDTSSEENFAMLSRMSTITGKNEEQVQNKIIKPPKKSNLSIIQTPGSKSESSSDKSKKSPAIISLNINKRGDD